MTGSDDENPPPPPPQQTPTQQAPHTVSTIKLHILKKGEYDIWAMKMEHYLSHTDYPIWEVIQKGNGHVSVSIDTNEVIKVMPPKTAEDILARERERKTRTTLLMALPEDHLAKFHKMTDAKEMWDAIKSIFGGNNKSKKMQKYILKQLFEGFSVSPLKMPIRSSLGLYLLPGPNVHIWIHEESEELDEFDLEEMDLKWQVAMISMRLKKFYKKDRSRPTKCRSKGNQDRRRRDAGNTGYRAKDNGRRPGKQEEPKALVTLNGEGIDWTGHAEDEQENFALWLIVIQAQTLSQMSTRDKSELRSSDVEDSPVHDRFANVEGMHAVPLPMTGNYMPLGPDREVDDSMFTYGPKHSKISESDTQTSNYDSCESNSSAETLESVPEPVVVEPKVLGIIIRDCDFHEKRMAKQVELIKKKGKGYWHMTGNKAYFVEYQDYNGGTVAFRGSKGYITGKGKIKIGKLDFEDVCFVKELQHFNLFSVSQMCDKKTRIQEQWKLLNEFWVKWVKRLTVMPETPTTQIELLKRQPVRSENQANKTAVPERSNIVQEWSLLKVTEDLLLQEGAVELPVDVMQEELLQFKIQKVWILVDLPYGKKAIGTKWVYRNKKDERGVVVRNKQGHRQEEGIDYDEVFAPVARIEAIRIFLAFASYMGFIVYQMDVKSAFLYGIIDEEVYVSQPPGFVDPKFPKKVYKMSSMGELTFFLGLQVKQKEDGIFISQDKYVAEILKKFDFASVKTASTPIETQKPLTKDEEAADVDVHLYRSMIGSLMYLNASRPEAEYVAAVNCCGQVLWIQNQMLDYRFNFMNTRIYIDNESTICIVKNPVIHLKTKHIDIRHHFIRDAYEKKLIHVLKIHTNDNVADLLTKAFDVSIFLVGRWVMDDMMPFEVQLILLSTCGLELSLDANLRKGNYWKHGCSLSVGFNHHTTNGHQFTMSNRHQELTSPEQTASALAIPGQTATGKESLNPLMADSLPKTIQSNDPPLSRGYTFRSGEDSLKLMELMEFVQNCVTW
ncbi:retrovirus-related pol polyprotein from transposon TNT 1-94 [Tanacetum coccineum]